MAGYSGNAQALGRPLAPESSILPPPPKLPGFVEFGEAAFRAGAAELKTPRQEAGLLGSLVYRPTVFRRNEIALIAACAWRSAAKVDDLTALKRAKREIDQRLIGEASELASGAHPPASRRTRSRRDHLRSLRPFAPAGLFRKAARARRRRASRVYPSSRSLRIGSAPASATPRNSRSFRRLSRSPTPVASMLLDR